VVESGLRVCKGSQKVVQAKEIIKFQNNLWYIEGKVVSKQAEKVTKQAEFAVIVQLELPIYSKLNVNWAYQVITYYFCNITVKPDLAGLILHLFRNADVSRRPTVVYLLY